MLALAPLLLAFSAEQVENPQPAEQLRNVNVCRDRLGSPLGVAGHETCASYSGLCDSHTLTTLEKARLLLHCPSTCKGAVYNNDRETSRAYCVYQPGHESCFDEPNDCDVRPAKSGTVIAHVSRRPRAISNHPGRRLVGTQPSALAQKRWSIGRERPCPVESLAAPAHRPSNPLPSTGDVPEDARPVPAR